MDSAVHGVGHDGVTFTSLHFTVDKNLSTNRGDMCSITGPRGFHVPQSN